MFVIHETLPNKRKLKKMMQCPFINILLFNMVVVFFMKGRYYYAFTIKNAKKHPKVLSKSSKFLNCSRFN